MERALLATIQLRGKPMTFGDIHSMLLRSHGSPSAGRHATIKLTRHTQQTAIHCHQIPHFSSCRACEGVLLVQRLNALVKALTSL